MRKAGGYSRLENEIDAQKMARMLRAIDACPRPVVALAHGAAIGGGVGLVAAADIAIAAEGTVFSLAEVRLGILPAVISPYVLRAIGPRSARDLFLTGDRFDAREAHRIGLVHQVVAAGELEEAGRPQGRVAAGRGARGRGRGQEADRKGRGNESGRRDAADRRHDLGAARLGGSEGRPDGVSREAQAVVGKGDRRSEGNSTPVGVPEVRQGLLRVAAGRASGRPGEVLLLRQPVRGRGRAAKAARAAGAASRGRAESELTMSGKRKEGTLGLALLVVFAAGTAVAQDATVLIERLTGPSSRLETDLRVLTDQIGGRVTGSAGYEKALQWGVDGVPPRRRRFREARVLPDPGELGRDRPPRLPSSRPANFRCGSSPSASRLRRPAP